MLDHRLRYLQLAFNYDAALVRRVLPRIAPSDRVLIEAGTPYLKREGLDGLRLIRSLWRGLVVADLKTIDGAQAEVAMVAAAGANAATVLGSSPPEALDFFVDTCNRAGLT